MKSSSFFFSRYANIEVNVSKPIVPFRETIIPRPRVDRVNEAIQDQNTLLSQVRLKDLKDDEEVLEEGLVEIFTPNHQCVVTIRAVPLPNGVTDCILRHQDVIKTLDALVAVRAGENCDLQADFQVRIILDMLGSANQILSVDIVSHILLISDV